MVQDSLTERNDNIESLQEMKAFWEQQVRTPATPSLLQRTRAGERVLACMRQNALLNHVYVRPLRVRSRPRGSRTWRRPKSERSRRRRRWKSRGGDWRGAVCMRRRILRHWKRRWPHAACVPHDRPRMLVGAELSPAQGAADGAKERVGVLLILPTGPGVTSIRHLTGVGDGPSNTHFRAVQEAQEEANALRKKLEKADADLFTTRKGAAAMKQQYDQVRANNDVDRQKGSIYASKGLGALDSRALSNHGRCAVEEVGGSTQRGSRGHQCCRGDCSSRRTPPDPQTLKPREKRAVKSRGGGRHATVGVDEIC